MSIQNPEGLIDRVPAITRGYNSQVASTQLSSLRCFLAKVAFVRFADSRMGLSPFDSLFEDFLQEISERRPPDEHAMGSGQDGGDMFDIQLA